MQALRRPICNTYRMEGSALRDLMFMYLIPLLGYLVESAALAWYICRFGVSRSKPGWLSVVCFLGAWTMVDDALHRLDVGFLGSLERDVGMLFLLFLCMGIFFRVSWDKRAYISITYCAADFAAKHLSEWIKLGSGRSQYIDFDVLDEEMVHFSIEQMLRYQHELLVTEFKIALLTAGFIFWLLYILNWLFRAKEMRFRWGELLFMATPLFTGYLFSAFYSEATRGVERSVAIPEQVKIALNITMTVTMLLLIVIMMIEVYVLQKNYSLVQERTERMVFEREFMSFREHALEIERIQKNFRSMRHDMHNHIAVLSKLAADGDAEELRNYLTTMTSSIKEINGKYATGSIILDALLNAKAEEAEGIAFTVEEVAYSQVWGINEYDLCILLGNALDNAIRACRSMQEHDRYVLLKSYVRGRMVFIEVVNSYEGSIRTTAGSPYPSTDKEASEEHGLGFASMQRVVDKYHGALDWKAEEGTFRLTAMLQMAEREA